MSDHTPQVSEDEARRVAEASRQAEWTQPSFLRELYLGRFAIHLIDPYPLAELERERPEFTAFFSAFREFCETEVDPIEIDRTGEYPQRVLDGLRKLGAFGMKIPTEYGGLGLTQVEYQRVMQYLGGLDGNLTALLSAHQSIGVPQPLKLFGSEELKKEYLPRCAAGEISAFALTEPEVGSDPARMQTTAVPTEDGEAFVLNGTKLWCTNGTIADLLVVMAQEPGSKKISAFVVEMGWPGVEVTHRCHFMGLRALANAEIEFHDVRVPRRNLIGEAGRGLKIALTTLNDGRLSIPNTSVGTVKAAMEITRRWSNQRVQWGKPIGRHEAITHKLARIASLSYAMESMIGMVTAMADRGHTDIRLEAAAAKEWGTFRGWQIVDDTMQIRGGRGYETETSLAARGEEAIGVERMMRDFRINKIFEGSSEIMHLFMAREAVDKHLHVAGALIDPRQSVGAKLVAAGRSALFYLWWYPSRWLGWSRWPRFSRFGPLARHMRFVERSSRKLARQIFHGMMVYRGKLQRKQAFLFRLVDVANELFAMASAASRARALQVAGDESADGAVELADLFCRQATREVKALFHQAWHNDDVRAYELGVRMLDGDYEWQEAGVQKLEVALARQAGKAARPGAAPEPQAEPVPEVART